jgi:3-oxoadipate enol-lactonase
MQDHLFEARGIAYRTNEFAPGRQTLVFVHGLSSSASAWTRYEDAFEGRYNVLTFDLRGHGQSHKPPGSASYTIAALAEDLEALVTFLGLDSIVLIGHSYGALVALEFLARHQDKVSKAVLLSPDYKIGRRLPEKILNAALRVSPILDVLPFSSQPAGRIDYTPYLGTSDWHPGRLGADIGKTGLRVYLYCTRQSYGFDREAFLEHITVPVLLMHGKKDTIFPVANSLHMAGRIPGSQLILLDDADHIVVLNHFPELSAAIAEFVARP